MMATVLKRSVQPGHRIRVLVVDDSVVIRRLVTHALSEDPDIEVVGSASNGKIALARIPSLNPDVVTLDIEMPEMDGLELLRVLSKEPSRPRVIMFSTLTERGAAVTLEALSLGADDYVAKAANVGSLDVSLASLRAEMVPKIKQFFLFSAPVTKQPVKPPVYLPRPLPAFQQTPGKMRHAEVLVIGVSTGGPVALAHLIPEFPADFPIPVLIVQHMPPLFTRFLADRLQTTTPLKVEEAAQGSFVTAGKILLAPGDFHMRVHRINSRVQVQLDQGPPENSCRPAVDVMFRSVADVYGGNVISTVLTGMGQDGMRGAAALRSLGAYVIAQDEPTSVVWGMPGSVVAAGLADAVLPLDGIMAGILSQVEGG